MLRILRRHHRHLRRPLSTASPPPSPSTTTSIDSTAPLPPPSLIISSTHHPRTLSLSSSASSRRSSILAISAAALTTTAAATGAYLVYNEDQSSSKEIYDSIERAIDRTSESVAKIAHRMKRTGVAASVLWESLRSVLSSANYEVRSGFEFRVASFLADIAAANGGRRAAIVAAGGGKAVDWLLESVAAGNGDGGGMRGEAARALAYMIADPVVRVEVFERPGAVPCLLRFIFASQPQRAKKQSSSRSSFEVSDSLRGRSMLVAAIMDVVTSNRESSHNASFQSLLPARAEMRDIAAAIQVIEGGMNVDDHYSDEDDDGGTVLKGIGMKVLGNTTIVGLSRTNGLAEYAEDAHVDYGKFAPQSILNQRKLDGFLAGENLSSAVVPGLWDDLNSQHVAMPFAAWALANWAMASERNRIHIHELDRDGNAVMTAIAAPERSVKWHGSLVARLLLEDNNLPLHDYVSDWSMGLLSSISEACKAEDIPLAQVALSAFSLSLERSHRAKKLVMEKGLPTMREATRCTAKHKYVQESLAKALELMCTDDIHLPLEDSEKWSAILIPWACGKISSEKTRSSATKILSCILEEYGPLTVPISQGWLTFLLSEILGTIKSNSSKGNARPKNDNVKTQISQSNISSATQVANLLASAAVKLAGNQLGTGSDSAKPFALEDLLLQEPFVGPYKSWNKERKPNFHVMDSAVATLKGIKALTEVCSEDPLYQNMIADSGVLCLLRRYLLRDDYEKLAAMEAYDASRARETQEQTSNNANETAVSDDKTPSSVKIPPAAHIRRHAARLLTVLSAFPKVQKVILADKIWCRWLEDCANGKIHGCDDLKIQSYARATLSNVFCTENAETDHRSSASGSNPVSENPTIPHWDDTIFLINPKSPLWKCPDKSQEKTAVTPDVPDSGGSSSAHEDDSERKEGGSSNHKGDDVSCSNTASLPIDIIFVHGLRGGPLKTWRLYDTNLSNKSSLVEKIDLEAGKQDTFWPGEWLSADFPHARIFTLKYKTNLTQWSGASLPLQEVSSMLLEKLVAADIGKRPIVFVSHSMGGLVVKQILYQAKADNLTDIVDNTVGIVFYSCPHFGSKLADMPWRMGLVLRPAPTIGELRSGSPRLVELNDFIRCLHKKGSLEVLSFCETKVTPLVEGYGGWAFRMEIVPIESAYPGYGDLVVLESTDHINSCKPVNRDDPSYKETLDFLQKLKAEPKPA
ncbi:SERAC1-like protein [Drosera capensis]